MIFTTHILSGAAIGAEVKNPYAVAGLAVVLHFLLDMIPHGDYVNEKSTLKDWWKEAISFSTGIFLLSIVFAVRGIPDWPTLRNIGIGIFFSLLPDATHFMYRFMGMKFLRPIKDFHEGLHYWPNRSPHREFRLKNEYWEIAVILISLISLLFLIPL
jgi:hypothetical protein